MPPTLTATLALASGVRATKLNEMSSAPPAVTAPRADLRPRLCERPVDGLGEDRRAFRHGRHRVDVRRSRDAELERHPIPQRLVMRRSADEHDALDVVAREARLLQRLADGLDRLVHLFANQASNGARLNGMSRYISFPDASSGTQLDFGQGR